VRDAQPTEPSEREVALMATIGRLEDQIVILEAAMGFLTLPPLEWGLTTSEARLFGALMERELLTKDAAMAALYRDRGADEPELKIVDVFVCKLRKKIAPFGLTIETRWGVGWQMSAASKAIARAMIADVADEVAA
jgi:two-component system cell cycle response regulator CtrA